MTRHAPPQVLEMQTRGSRFSFTVPAGWELGTTPDDDALLWCTEPGSFRANAVVSSVRLPATLALEDVVADAYEHLVAAYDDVDARGVVTTEITGAPALVTMTLLDVRAADSRRAARVAQYTVFADGGVRQSDDGDYRVLHQLVATCALDEISRFENVFRELFDSCVLTVSPTGDFGEEGE